MVRGTHNIICFEVIAEAISFSLIVKAVLIGRVRFVYVAKHISVGGPGFDIRVEYCSRCYCRIYVRAAVAEYMSAMSICRFGLILQWNTAQELLSSIFLSICVMV